MRKMGTVTTVETASGESIYFLIRFCIPGLLTYSPGNSSAGHLNFLRGLVQCFVSYSDLSEVICYMYSRKTGHRSRKKAREKREEEERIAARERALEDDVSCFFNTHAINLYVMLGFISRNATHEGNRQHPDGVGRRFLQYSDVSVFFAFVTLERGRTRRRKQRVTSKDCWWRPRITPCYG